MNKDDMILAAEDEWLANDDRFFDLFELTRNELTWPWFWLLCAEAIWSEEE